MHKFLRYLRIAGSATCGIACVLLCALWVRSYWYDDALYWNIVGHRSVLVASTRGRLVGYTDLFEMHRRGTGRFYLLSESQIELSPIYPLASGIRSRSLGGMLGAYSHHLVTSHWMVVLVAGTLGTVFGIRRFYGIRFSLRTLLVATTLIAVFLGLIVGATRLRMVKRLRYLRIAFVAFGGVVAVLLIALWIRSYWNNTAHPNATALTTQASASDLDAKIAKQGSVTFRSFGGEWVGADGDTDLTFLPNGSVHMTEYSVAVFRYAGTYKIDFDGLVTVQLPWPAMFMQKDATSLLLVPVQNESDSKGQDYWPFRPLNATEEVQVRARIAN